MTNEAVVDTMSVNLLIKLCSSVTFTCYKVDIVWWRTRAWMSGMFYR